MGLINVPDETDLTTADANDLNSRFAIVTGLVNGNIDNANIKAGGVATSNLATGAVTTTKLADGAVTPQQMYNPYKFSAYQTVETALPATTWTKTSMNTESFDTSNNFDTSLSRFTATANGYYQISAQIGVTSSGANSGSKLIGALYKNGTGIVYSTVLQGVGSDKVVNRPVISRLLYLNSGDYLETYAYCEDARVIQADATGAVTWMTGYMVSQT